MNTEQTVSLSLPFNELRKRVNKVLTDFTGNTFKESKLNVATSRILGFDNFKALEATLSQSRITTLQEEPIYLTNSICESTGNLGKGYFDRAGLSYGECNGEFYPLTHEEEQFIGEEYIQIGELPAYVEFGFSCFMTGQKWASPTIDIPFRSETFMDDSTPYLGVARQYAEELTIQLKYALNPIGGEVINMRDVGDRYNVVILVPFDKLISMFSGYKGNEFGAWVQWVKSEFDQIVNHPDLFAQKTPETFWSIIDVGNAYELHFSRVAEEVLNREAFSRRVMKKRGSMEAKATIADWEVEMRNFGPSNIEV